MGGCPNNLDDERSGFQSWVMAIRKKSEGKCISQGSVFLVKIVGQRPVLPGVLLFAFLMFEITTRNFIGLAVHYLDSNAFVDT